MAEDVMNNGGEYGKYIMQDLTLPAVHAAPEAIAKYNAAGRARVHWLDGETMEGAPFQINTAWYYKENHDFMDNWAASEPNGIVGKPHVHDVPELLCFYGSDPYNPNDLGGEIEFWIEGEKHILTKSSLIFIPAGVSHLPLYVNRADRPILHFSMLMDSAYTLKTNDGTSFRAE